MDSSLDPIKSAAQHLTSLRHTGRFEARLPEPIRPATVEQALQIQDRIVRVLGDRVGGYKCSLPTADRTIVAPVFAGTIGSAVPCMVRPADPDATEVARVEPEVAFIMGRDLPARAQGYTEAEVRAAIGEVRLVLELIGSRYRSTKDLPFPEHLADCLSNQGLFIGPLVPGGLDAALEAIPVSVCRNDSGAEETVLLEREGKHPNTHPLNPLLWLGDWLARRGTGLAKGQVVTTGSYCGLLDVPLDTPLTFRFGDLGRIDIEFRRA